MKTKTLIAVTLAAAAGATGAGVAIANTADGPGEGRAGAATSAATSAPRIHDIDADLLRNGRLRLEVETARASRVTFTFGVRQYAGRVVEVDREDGTRDWARTVGTRAAAGRRVTIRVKACSGQRCASKSSSEVLERPERDDD